MLDEKRVELLKPDIHCHHVERGKALSKGKKKMVEHSVDGSVDDGVKEAQDDESGGMVTGWNDHKVWRSYAARK